jgi:hypothetical protein
MKYKFLFLVFIITLPFYGQVKENNYLNELKSSINQQIDSLELLNSKEKIFCLNKVFELLKTDKRIIKEIPYFAIEFDIVIHNDTKEVNYVYGFGTQASLTSKSFIIENQEELILTYNYLYDYPKKNMSVFDINNKNDLITNKILISKTITLIGYEFYNFIMNSSFQNRKIEKSFFIEEFTKIYDSWDRSILCIFEINNGVFYFKIKDINDIKNISESNIYPSEVLEILDKWDKNTLFK